MVKISFAVLYLKKLLDQTECLHNGKLTKNLVEKMKWQLDESWHKSKLMNWPVDEMSNWNNGKLINQQMDEMVIWPNDKLMKG